MEMRIILCMALALTACSSEAPAQPSKAQLQKQYDSIMDVCMSDEECDKAHPICNQLLVVDPKNECKFVWLDNEEQMDNQNYLLLKSDCEKNHNKKSCEEALKLERHPD